MSMVVIFSDLRVWCGFRMGLQLQRRLQDCGEDAEQRRVQELLGHGRRLLGSERVGAEPPWDGLVQPVRGGSRDAVAGDPGSRRPHWDDLCTHSVPSNYSQASSRQRRLMSGAETTSKCKSQFSFYFEMQLLFCAFPCLSTVFITGLTLLRRKCRNAPA